jgi:hypothetical protein
MFISAHQGIWYDGWNEDFSTVQVVHRGFGFSTLGVLATCTCSSTLLDQASFAKPESDYYSGAVIDTTDITVNVKGTAVTASLLIDRLVDTVSFMCEEYNISCGDKAPAIFYQKTGD